MDDQNAKDEKVMIYLPDSEKIAVPLCTRLRLCTGKMSEKEITDSTVKYTYNPSKDHYEDVLNACDEQGFTTVVTHDPELSGKQNRTHLEEVIDAFSKHNVKFVCV